MAWIEYLVRQEPILLDEVKLSEVTIKVKLVVGSQIYTKQKFSWGFRDTKKIRVCGATGVCFKTWQGILRTSLDL